MLSRYETNPIRLFGHVLELQSSPDEKRISPRNSGNFDNKIGRAEEASSKAVRKRDELKTPYGSRPRG
jgi:hypothetical protein